MRGAGVVTTVKIERDLLRSIPLFSNASEEHLASILTAATHREAAARTVLFAENDPVKCLFVLLSGAVELFSERDDRRVTLAVVLPPHPVATSSIFANRSLVCARTLEPSELIVVPANLIFDLISRDVGLAHAAAVELASEQDQMIQDLKSHRLFKTSERVADWILRRDGKTGGTGNIVIPFDKRVLASYLGMAPEQLSRHFAALASAGILIQGRNIKLTNREALAEIAGLPN
jgi:CRP/FNR family transcriptional activator FtrB